MGKSSTARRLAEKQGAFVVAETGSLFPRPEGAEPGSVAEQRWFWSCNVKRWQIATEQERHYPLVVLDGDPLKLWYDWIYGIDPATWREAVMFYRHQIQAHAIGFPDTYYVLIAKTEDLRTQKAQDSIRRRRNFEKHLALIEPQKRLFCALNTAFPRSVTFIQATSLEETLGTILEASKTRNDDDRYSLSRWNFLVRWMEQNPVS